jgi:hypothetical protein
MYVRDDTDLCHRDSSTLGGFIMPTPSISRRHVLGAGVAATAAGTLALTGARVEAGDSSGTDDPRRFTETVGTLRRAEVLSTPAAGEHVLFVAGASLAPNGTIAGASSFSAARGVSPRIGAGGFAYLSTSINLPVGTTMRNVEFILEGAPQTGRIALIRWTPDLATAPFYLYQQNIPAAVNGISVYTQALTEVVDGVHSYEAFYTDNGTATTCAINGVRVRYTAPTLGLVAITPSRVYDSRLPMSPDQDGLLVSGANRTISVDKARNLTTGVLGAVVVPANATAVAYTLTVDTVAGGGFLSVNPGGNTTVTASAVNWSAPGQLLANTGLVALGAGTKLTVIAGGGGTTHFAVDVVGYYA